MSGLPKTPSFRLDRRRALVTGASRGIGLASAVALAEAGAEVTMVARGVEELEARASEIRAAGLLAYPLTLDVGNVEAVERALADAGPFDILVNNAGVSRHRRMLDTRPEDFDHVMAINLRAAYFVAKTVASGMVAANRQGVILHISSQMGHVGGIERTVYSASKHAIGVVTASAAW
jgi:NAD(P)-dependent dehydrogenase (short-subunit alcohol dehydrogenase family)